MEHLIRALVPVSEAPPNIGVHYVDTAHKRMWFSVGTSAVGDWVEQAIGDGITQVPTVTLIGSGSPEGVVTSVVGNFYWDSDAKFLYFKETGVGNTGWVVH